MGIIDTIIEKKRIRLREAVSRHPIGAIRASAEKADAPLNFRAAITRQNTSDPVRLIAELKKASPSKGLIRADFSPDEIAKVYDRKADAISVLTEEDFFQGHLDFIRRVKDISQRPVLRKDFIFDEYQIYEARAAGADALLLIVMALSNAQITDYLALAGELGMGVLTEVHDIKELERALKCAAPVIGINNRNLGTLEISLETTFNLLREIPRGHTVVSESGISGPAEVRRLEEAGVDAMLVGTSIMREKDIGAKIDQLRGK